MLGVDPRGRGMHSGQPRQVADVSDLVVGHQRDDHAVGTGAGGTSGAVQVGLVLDRRVGVDDDPDVVDVDAASGDVGRHEGRGVAPVEALHVAGPGVLAEVAVQLDRRHPGGVEELRQLLGAVLGPGEDHAPSGGGGEVHEHRHPPFGADVQHVVGHRGDGALRRVGLVRGRAGEEALDEDVHAGVEGRGEEHALTVAGRGVHDPADPGQEAEVGHVVGLVEDRDLDRAQVDVALAHEVLEAAGAGDDDVDATAQAGDLAVLAHPTEDGDPGQAGRCREGRQRLVDLGDQLTGGGEDEGSGPAGPARCPALGEARDEREEEGIRLARPGAAAAEDVPAAERVRQRGRLDRGRGGDAEGREDVGERTRDTEVGEGRVSRHR